MFSDNFQEVNIMETNFIFATIFEIALVAFCIFGLFNEQKFAETERKVGRAIKRCVRAFINGSDLSREKI